jgi:predicted O-methyltransferase YrrM
MVRRSEVFSIGQVGMRAFLRRKIINLVDEVVEQRTEDLRRSYEAQLSAASKDILEAVRQYEIRQRRDVFFAGEVRAVAETALFVEDHMREVRCFAHPNETLKHAIELVRVDGLVLEFGVATGTSLTILTEGLPKHQVYGFDVFTGLPEPWRPGFPAGAFAQDELPRVPGAELVVGLFADTLPGFLREHDGPLALLHLDADLYSATRDVLQLLGDRLVPGSVVVFDEYFNYPGWREGEFRAWAEFVDVTGLRYTYRAYTFNNEQVVVVVE